MQNLKKENKTNKQKREEDFSWKKTNKKMEF